MDIFGLRNSLERCAREGAEFLCRIVSEVREKVAALGVESVDS
jgi:hypothetical protein